MSGVSGSTAGPEPSGTVLDGALPIAAGASLVFADGTADAGNLLAADSTLTASSPGTATLGFSGALAAAGQIEVSGNGTTLAITGAVSTDPQTADGSAVLTNTGTITVGSGAALVVSLADSALAIAAAQGNEAGVAVHGGTFESGTISVAGGQLSVSASDLQPSTAGASGFDLTGLVSVSNGSLLMNAAMEQEANASGGVGLTLSNSSATFAAAVGQGVAITLGGDVSLTVDQPQSFAATISGIGAGDSVDLVGTAFNGVEPDSNGLVLTEGGTPVASLILRGLPSVIDVAITPDGLLGDRLSFAAPPAGSSVTLDPTTREQIAIVSGAHAAYATSGAGGDILAASGGNEQLFADVDAIRFSDGITYFSNASTAADVYRVALALTGSAPDAVDAGRWVSDIGAGTASLADVATEIMGAASLPTDNAAFLKAVFVNATGQGPDATTLAADGAALAGGATSRAALVASLATSPAAKAASLTAMTTDGLFVATYLPVAAGAHVPVPVDTGTATVVVQADGSASVQGATGGTTQVEDGATVIVFTNGVARIDPTGNAEAVAHLYRAAFNRDADLSGLKYWAGELDGGAATLGDVASTFAGSAEFEARYGALSDSQFVNQLYQNVLGRAADSAGEGYWVGELGAGVSRGTVLTSFAESFENVQATLGHVGALDYGESYRLYQAGLDRTPDSAGLGFWYGQLQGGTTPLQMAQAFTQTPEFRASYAGLGNAAFVNRLYENTLGRAADAAGASYWTAQMAGGTTQAQVLLSFSDSAENRAATAAATHDGYVFIPT